MFKINTSDNYVCLFLFVFVEDALRFFHLEIEPARQHDQYDHQQAQHRHTYPKIPGIVISDEPIGYGGIPIIDVLHSYHVLYFYAAR